MPFTYERDDQRRLISVTMRDPMTFEETLSVVDRQLADGAWSYSLLYDARVMISHATPADARRLLDHVEQLAAEHGPRGPVALVTRDPAVIAAVQRYAFSASKTNIDVQVFWDVDDAEAWLRDAVLAR
jgi:hypothetical protein